jgi:hypothetical protein
VPCDGDAELRDADAEPHVGGDDDDADGFPSGPPCGAGAAVRTTSHVPERDDADGEPHDGKRDDDGDAGPRNRRRAGDDESSPSWRRDGDGAAAPSSRTRERDDDGGGELLRELRRDGDGDGARQPEELRRDGDDGDGGSLRRRHDGGDGGGELLRELRRDGDGDGEPTLSSGQHGDASCAGAVRKPEQLLASRMCLSHCASCCGRPGSSFSISSP